MSGLPRVMWLMLGMALAPLPLWAADERQALLDRADALEAEGRPAEVLALLEPHADGDDVEVIARLASAAFLQASQGDLSGAVTEASIRPAIDYARRTAELGDPMGWNLLWVIYANGVGVVPDMDRALGYLRAGVEGGDPGAMLNMLEDLYSGSPWIEQDVEAACAMYDRLIDTGQQLPPVVPYLRAWMLMKGECGLRADPAAGFAQINALAVDGLEVAQRVTGMALKDGWFAAPDPAASVPWFELAAAQGDAESMWQLGTLFAFGQGVDVDYARAVDLFRQAAEWHYPPAMTSLAVMYASGQGVAQDFARARVLYGQAVAAGETHALRNLAVMHALGQGGPPDPVQAQVYYLQHRHAGNPASEQLEQMIGGLLDAAGRAEAQQRFQDWLALQDILSVQ